MPSRALLSTGLLCALLSAGFQESKAEASMERARRYYEQRRLDEAEVMAAEALSADPRMSDAEILLGLIFTMRSQFTEAEKHFTRAVTLQPENYRAHAYLAATYLQDKRMKEAAAAFHKVLDLNPDNAVANYNLGIIGLAEHSPAEALARFENVLRADSSDVAALSGIMECQLLLQKLPAARASARRLASLLPDNDPRLFQAASLLAQHGESAVAIPMMERARHAYPDSFDVNYNLSLALLDTGQLDQAAVVLQPFTSPQGRAEAFDLLGQIDEKRHRPEAAESGFHQAAQRDPGNEDYLFDYGNSLLQHGKLQPAADVFRAAVSTHPRSWKLRLGLGSACYLFGDYPRSVQALLEAVRLKPDSAIAFFLLGEAYDSAGPLQQAIEAALQSYLRTEPRDAWAYYHYGVILHSAEPLHKALLLNPNFAEAYLQIGILELEQAKTAGAIANLEKAAHLDTNLAAAHYRLGLAYKKMGNQQRAEAEFGRFRALKDQETYRSRVLESLAAAAR